MLSRSIYIFAKGKISFFLKVEGYFTVCKILFILSSFDGFLGCFHDLSFVSKATLSVFLC